ncbi:hypothetical protein [Paracraurococcus lichenis]|uniref:Phasin domain-containing protein n=1 Tax=Paracraurococcus lichenis TaxID=3064888 RepID=A0ABT9E2G2_9PROT|nr:hypothetical protein [Paracraurococcus sp. LOR1-02]MDO9710285.1 hypothetical protein [Paracraurococcus sp. LOR1-02]
MADGNNGPNDRTPTAEVVRRGNAAARGAAEAMREGASVAEEATRPARQAGAEVARRGLETTRQAGEAAAGMAAQGTAETLRRTEEMEGQARQGLEAMWRMFPAPMPGAGGMPDFSQMVSEMVRTNLRIGQELFRLANPAAMIEFQQRMLRSYLDALQASQSMLLGTARRTTEEMEREIGPGR